MAHLTDALLENESSGRWRLWSSTGRMQTQDIQCHLVCYIIFLLTNSSPHSPSSLLSNSSTGSNWNDDKPQDNSQTHTGIDQSSCQDQVSLSHSHQALGLMHASPMGKFDSKDASQQEQDDADVWRNFNLSIWLPWPGNHFWQWQVAKVGVWFCGVTVGVLIVATKHWIWVVAIAVMFMGTVARLNERNVHIKSICIILQWLTFSCFWFSCWGCHADVYFYALLSKVFRCLRGHLRTWKHRNNLVYPTHYLFIRYMY